MIYLPFSLEPLIDAVTRAIYDDYARRRNDLEIRHQREVMELERDYAREAHRAKEDLIHLYVKAVNDVDISLLREAEDRKGDAR